MLRATQGEYESQDDENSDTNPEVGYRPIGKKADTPLVRDEVVVLDDDEDGGGSIDEADLDDEKPPKFGGNTSASRSTLLSSVQIRHKASKSNTKMISDRSTSHIPDTPSFSVQKSLRQVEGTVVPPARYDQPFAQEHLDMHGLDIFFQGHEVLWRDIYGSPAQEIESGAPVEGGEEKDKAFLSRVAGVWSSRLERLVTQDFDLPEKIGRELFSPVGSRLYARLLRLHTVHAKKGEDQKQPVLILCLRFCNSKSDKEDMKKNKSLPITVGGLTNRCVIIFNDTELASIHRTDIKKFWKLRTNWEDHLDKVRRERNRSVGVTSVVNSLLKKIIKSFERPIVADLKMIDKDYSVVMSATKKESETLIERATRIKRKTQVFKRILLLQATVIKRYLVLTDQEGDVYSDDLDETINALIEMNRSLHDAADSLIGLHISVSEHKSNEILNTLTFISAIFLPLTFLCGVYGMNFEYIPELNWHLGYLYFWMLVVGIVIVITSFYIYKGWV